MYDVPEPNAHFPKAKVQKARRSEAMSKKPKRRESGKGRKTGPLGRVDERSGK
jgi:hypothetical protein